MFVLMPVELYSQCRESVNSPCPDSAASPRGCDSRGNPSIKSVLLHHCVQTQWLTLLDNTETPLLRFLFNFKKCCHSLPLPLARRSVCVGRTHVLSIRQGSAEQTPLQVLPCRCWRKPCLPPRDAPFFLPLLSTPPSLP